MALCRFSFDPGATIPLVNGAGILDPPVVGVPGRPLRRLLALPLLMLFVGRGVLLMLGVLEWARLKVGELFWLSDDMG